MPDLETPSGENAIYSRASCTSHDLDLILLVKGFIKGSSISFYVNTCKYASECFMNYNLRRMSRVVTSFSITDWLNLRHMTASD